MINKFTLLQADSERAWIKTKVQWVNKSETNCEAKKKVTKTCLKAKLHISVTQTEYNWQVTYFLSVFRIKKLELWSAKMQVVYNAVSYIEYFGLWVHHHRFVWRSKTLQLCYSSVWLWQTSNLKCLCGHFMLALQTSSKSSRSSVTTLIISKLKCYQAVRVNQF